MNLGLAGKTALVTGASRGIGRAIAVVLAAEGMQVLAVARSSADLEALAAEHPAVTPFVADLATADGAGAAVAAAVERLGSLDLLVNNAGATVRGDLLSLTDAQWEAGFALKFYGYLRMARAAWPHLRARGGRLVNVIGVGSRAGNWDGMMVGAVNSAIVSLTKSLADRGVDDGVRVVAINPGNIATDRWTARVALHAGLTGLDAQEAEAAMVKAARIARVGQPEEIARMVALVASDAASYLQGAVIDVDGGLNRAL